MMEQSNFQNLIASARQRNRAARGVNNSVQSQGTTGGSVVGSPPASSNPAVTSTPLVPQLVVPSVAAMAGTPDQTLMIQKLMNEVDKKKRWMIIILPSPGASED